MKLLGATILENKSGENDVIFLKTDLPNPLWPFTGTLILKFETVHNKGYKHVIDSLKEVDTNNIKRIKL